MKSASTIKYDPLDWARQKGSRRIIMQEMEAALRVKTKKRRRRIVATASATAVLVAAAWLIPLVRQTSTIETPAGQRQRIALADGSSAELNAGTELKTDFRYGRRHLQLIKGEGFFTVAHDSAHPFLVETSAGVVRVTGTKFNVRLNSAAQPEVVLLEGSVAMHQVAATPIALKPGEEFAYGQDGPSVRPLTPAELDRFTAWRTGRIVLEGLTLADAAERYSAYTGRKIAVMPAVATLRLGGAGSLDDLPDFLGGLQETFALKVTNLPDGSVHIGPR